MVVLNRSNERKTIKFELGSYPGSKVYIYDSFVMDDYKFLAELDTLADEERIDSLLARMITDWNLTDESLNKLEITAENVSYFDFMDKAELQSATAWGRHLTAKAEEIMANDMKKKASLLEPTTESVPTT